mgnify:CR=1 FL=1
MANPDLTQMKPADQSKLVDNRWSSSDELWDQVSTIYDNNTRIYANKGTWLDNIPYIRQAWIVQANRIFVNMEAVINSLIANPPGINILPGRSGQTVQDFAMGLEKYLKKKLVDRNLKETIRKGLRNLYFARLIVIKAFWNPVIDDFDFRALDPRKVRFGKYSTKEQDSEFAIEEIEDNLCAVVSRFPDKKSELMKKFGFPETPEGEMEMYVRNPDVTYKEAWIMDHVIFKLDNIVLGTIKNPYWDWKGILITDEERKQLKDSEGDARRQLLTQIKLQQGQRRAEKEAFEGAVDMEEAAEPAETPEQALETIDATPRPEEAGAETIMAEEGELEPSAEGATSEVQAAPDQAATPQYRPYYFNYFDSPRKPYIFATIFNNENSPIGRTDMIELSSTLQRGIDKRKMDIDENCEMANGILKVDAGTMGKADAQRIRFQTKGIVWGKNVKDGVTRETGAALPEMVFQDMVDSRQEIDNIMAASSAFRGEREGQETKAGRLALIQQSYLRLNELVQVVDYVYGECYGWAMQLSKSRYTEYRKASWQDDDGDYEEMEVIQDDFDEGNEVVVIPGKTLPVDDEFRFEQAQNDVMKGVISPVDYLKIAQYDDPTEMAKNAVIWTMNPAYAVGLTPEELALIAPPAKEEQKPVSKSMNFKDAPLDVQIQMAAQAGLEMDPAVAMAEKQAEVDAGEKDAAREDVRVAEGRESKAAEKVPAKK